MKKYILALDAGTSSLRALLFDREGRIRSLAQKEIVQSFPEPGWVEQDASEIWSSQLGVAVEAMSRVGATAADLAGIGITNQRETSILWDRVSGEPVAPAIVWQCRRSAGLVHSWQEAGYEELVRQKTGLVLDAYFSASKIRWLLDESPALRARAEQGDLCFGTVDSWLIYKLTEGRVHVTDMTNASRTLLYDIHRLRWDEELLKRFDIPAALLPEVLPSSQLFAETSASFFGRPVPILGVAGDQQAALVGQTCFYPGDAKNTYGTGCFLLMNTGSVPVQSQHGLLTTIAYASRGDVRYALEGSVFTAGSAIRWLSQGLGLLADAGASEEVAASVPDSGGVHVVPAFSGLGAPHWQPAARGTVVGLTGGSTAAHLVRAVLESLAFQSHDLLAAMQQDSGLRLGKLRVDGGASANDLLMQIQADVLGQPVLRPASVEATARGAALLAGFTAGFYDRRKLPAMGIDQTRFQPTLEEEKRQLWLAGWRRAVKTALYWAEA